MASPAPSPHPLARQLVCICVEQYRLRPGRSIPASRIWGALGAVEPEHFQDCMTDAIARAWLQKHGSEVQLIEAGYTAATGTRPPIVVDDGKQILNVAVHQLRVRVGDCAPAHPASSTPPAGFSGNPRRGAGSSESGMAEQRCSGRADSDRFGSQAV